MDRMEKSSLIIESYGGIHCALRVSILLQLKLPVLLPIAPSHLSPQLMRTTVTTDTAHMSIEIGFNFDPNMTQHCLPSTLMMLMTRIKTCVQ